MSPLTFCCPFLNLLQIDSHDNDRPNILCTLNTLGTGGANWVKYEQNSAEI